jgi:hypothetical protein
MNSVVYHVRQCFPTSRSTDHQCSAKEFKVVRLHMQGQTDFNLTLKACEFVLYLISSKRSSSKYWKIQAAEFSPKTRRFSLNIQDLYQDNAFSHFR